jgi:predicted membrane-bound spermidine synthase
VVYRTSHGDMLDVFKKVFSQAKYVVLSSAIAGVVFAFAVWLPNFKLISKIAFDASISMVEKLNFIFSLFGSIQTNFTIVSATYTIIIAILFGINISLLVYYIHRRGPAVDGSGASLSLGGLVSGIFGIGCATCGSFILTSLLGLFGAAGSFALLPFGGEECGFLGVGLLIMSTYWTTKNINKSATCPIN